jgi:hypothetical protein
MSITKVTDAGLDRSRIVTPLIINGDMSIAQRSTSTASITGAGYHTIDRYQIYLASLGTWTMSQSTDVPTGQGFVNSCKFDCTTADASPASGDEFYFRQRIEGQNLQYLKYGTSSAEKLTVSFWVKCNKATTATVALQDHDNSKMQVKSYTISSTNTWEKKIVTFSGNTSNSFTNDANLSLDVRWWLDSGSSFTSGTPTGDWEANDNAKKNPNNLALASSTDNEWYITGVQLETGEFDANTMPSFPFESPANNLRKCQRYYNQVDGGLAGAGAAGNQIVFSYNFPTEMRTAPSITVSAALKIDKVGDAASTQSSSDIGQISGSTSNKSAGMYAGNFSINSGQGSVLYNSSNGGGIVKFDSEI